MTEKEYQDKITSLEKELKKLRKKSSCYSRGTFLRNLVNDVIYYVYDDHIAVAIDPDNYWSDWDSGYDLELEKPEDLDEITRDEAIEAIAGICRNEVVRRLADAFEFTGISLKNIERIVDSFLVEE